MASSPVTLLALATAVPPNLLEQSAVATVARRIYAKSFAPLSETCRRVCKCWN
jgi:hypothetical protein